MSLDASPYEASACWGKARYAKRGQAERVRREVNPRHATRGSVECYRCHRCHGYHIGPSNKHQKRLAAQDRRPRIKTVRWDDEDD